MSKEHGITFKYSMASICGFVTDLVVLKIGIEAGLPPSWARVLSLTTAMQVTFLTNGLLIFRCLERRKLHLQWGGYMLTNAFGNLCNYLRKSAERELAQVGSYSGGDGSPSKGTGFSSGGGWGSSTGGLQGCGSPWGVLGTSLMGSLLLWSATRHILGVELRERFAHLCGKGIVLDVD